MVTKLESRCKDDEGLTEGRFSLVLDNDTVGETCQVLAKDQNLLRRFFHHVSVEILTEFLRLGVSGVPESLFREKEVLLQVSPVLLLPVSFT